MARRAAFAAVAGGVPSLRCFHLRSITCIARARHTGPSVVLYRALPSAARSTSKSAPRLALLKQQSLARDSTRPFGRYGTRTEYMRLLSTGTSDDRNDLIKKPDPARSPEPPKEAPLAARLRSLGIIAAVSGTVGLFGYNAYRISMWMSGLSLSHSLYFGVYLGGALSAAAAGAGFFTIRRFLSIHPESLFTDVLTQIKEDQVVTSCLGSNISAGKFKAYAYSGGLVYKDRSARKSIFDAMSFERYGLQLMFQVNGDILGGMVSVRAEQSILGSYFIRNLAIDFDDGDRLVLIGSPNDVAYKGIVRLR